MSLIIEHGKTKRIISGPYNVCGSRADLRLLQKAIELYVDDDWIYGWVMIECSGGMDGDFDVILRQRSISNTAPIGWDKGGSHE